MTRTEPWVVQYILDCSIPPTVTHNSEERERAESKREEKESPEIYREREEKEKKER